MIAKILSGVSTIVGMMMMMVIAVIAAAAAEDRLVTSLDWWIMLFVFSLVGVLFMMTYLYWKVKIREERERIDKETQQRIEEAHRLREMLKERQKWPG